MSQRASHLEDAGDRLHSAAIHLLRRVWDEDRKSGLSPARMSALSVLVFGGPRSLRGLAETEHVTAPTMSAIVAGLEADGLVRRHAHPQDRRSVRLEPTPKGRRLMQAARRRRIDALAALFHDIAPRDVQTLRRAAGIIEDAIGR